MDALNRSELANAYGRAFYEDTTMGSRAAAEAILSRLCGLRQLGSLLDVGCGVGPWLEVGRRLGAKRVVGIDGPHVPKGGLLFDETAFIPADLEMPLPDVGRFDITVCLEVAEHLTPGRGPGLVADLVATSDLIAFSAAIPYQGGDGHLNEMWPSYWGKIFGAYGFRPWDGLRREIWNLAEVPWWYRQNLILFVAEDSWQDLLGQHRPTPIEQLTAIHPECYLYAARRANVEFKTTLARDTEIYRRIVECPEETPGYGPEFSAPMVYGRRPR